MSVPAPREPWQEDIIFVTGYGRSGTTLMQGLLCASEDVMGMTAEAKLLRELIAAYARGCVSWRNHTWDYFADQDAYLGFMRSVIGSYIRHLRAHFDTGKRLLQKDPGLVLYIAETIRLLPNARFVVAVRDPRAALASRFEVDRRYRLTPNADREIARYVDTYAKLAQLPPAVRDRMTFVRYEHLVTDPTPTMARVSEFLSIRMPSDLRAVAWENKRRRTLGQASPLDGRPVSASSLAKYRQTLDPAVLARLEGQRHEIERRIGMPVFYDGDDPRETLAAAAAARRAGKHA